MGWWQITTEPEPDSGLPLGQGGLLNSVPGEAAPAELYCGDRPADLAGRLWAQARSRLDAGQFAALLAAGPQPATTLPPALLAEVGETRTLISQAYLEAWGRPPRPEEWRAMADFVCVEEEPPAAAGELVLKLWAACEAELTPAEFATFWTTSALPPALGWSARTEQLAAFQAQIRQAVEEAWREDLNRPPTEAERAALFNPADWLFTLPDGVGIPLALANTFFPELQDACGGDLSRADLLDLLLTGLTPEATADLAPDLAEAVTERMEGLAEIITQARGTPPVPEDWQALHDLGEAYC